MGDLTVFCRDLFKYGHDELLESSGGSITDNAILACLQYETDIEGRDQQIALDVVCIILKQTRQSLEDLELDI